MKLFREKGVLYNALDPVSVVIVLLLLLYSLISQGIIPIGRSTSEEGTLPPAKPLIEREVSLPKTYSIEGVWKVTVASVEFLPGRKNLRFNLLIENLQDKPAECEIAGKTYLLDNLGNRYGVSKISPSGRRSLIQNMPVKANIVFPELNEGTGSVILYLYFAGYDLQSGKWIGEEYVRYGVMSRKLYCGPIGLKKVPSVEETIEEVSLPKTFVTEDGNWSVTVDSYEFLEERKVRFILLIENLQEKTAECMIDKAATYLLDNLANEYHNLELSIEGYRKFVSHMPMRVYVSFPEIKEGVEAVVFYLRFSPRQGATGEWAIGPIKLEFQSPSTE